MVRIALLSALALLLSAVATGELGCSRSRPLGGSPGRTPTRDPRLPQPLPLPADPALAAHVADPGAVWATVAPFAPPSFGRTQLISAMLDAWGAPELTAPLSASIDFDRPWAAVEIGDETIVHFAVRRDGMEPLRQALSGRPPVGDFGAVIVGESAQHPTSTQGASQRSASASVDSPRLAWLDTRNATLTLAHGLRGIATGPSLPAAYGEHPLFATLSSSVLDRFGVAVPAGRISLKGSAPKRFEARFEQVARDEVPGLSEFAPGALTGLLQAPQVAWGASSRWARHEQAVADLISSIRQEVGRQNFLIRGILEELSRRLDVVLRSWNGRILVAGGPSNHLLVAFGAHDPSRAENAVLHLTQGVVDNLKLASTFGLGVPDLTLKRNVTRAHGHSIHQLTLRNATGTVPSELAMLLDGHKALHVAFAPSRRGGAAMVAVGPRAHQALAAWLRDTGKSVPATTSRDHLAAAAWAVDPKQVRTVMAQGRLQELLTLDAGTAPAMAVFRQVEDDFVLNVGPPDAFAP